jgi:hypothetical protein
VEVANDVAMSRPDVVLQPTPESRAVASPSSPAPKVPATPPSRAAEPKDQLLSGGAVRDKTAERQYLRVLPSPPQEKHAAREARGRNAPAKPAAGSSSAAPNATAIVVEAQAITDAQSQVLVPGKAEADSAARDSAAPASETGAEQPSVAKRKTSARSAASAPAAAPSRLVTGSNFAAGNAREAAERARIQQAQMSSNLMAGFVVQTPDPNVLWMVSDSGSVGRSEDAGASWKYQSLETIDHFVAGSAPTAKICWLVGEHGTILRTTDGKTWTTVQPPVVANFGGFAGIDAKDESSATLTTSDGRKFSTTDGGTTWNLAK